MFWLTKATNPVSWMRTKDKGQPWEDSTQPEVGVPPPPGAAPGCDELRRQGPGVDDFAAPSCPGVFTPSSCSLAPLNAISCVHSLILLQFARILPLMSNAPFISVTSHSTAKVSDLPKLVYIFWHLFPTVFLPANPSSGSVSFVTVSLFNHIKYAPCAQLPSKWTET